jgi:hypothetical protein
MEPMQPRNESEDKNTKAKNNQPCWPLAFHCQTAQKHQEKQEKKLSHLMFIEPMIDSVVERCNFHHGATLQEQTAPS